jgi:hypothetical protein
MGNSHTAYCLPPKEQAPAEQPQAPAPVAEPIVVTDQVDPKAKKKKAGK